jgi:hypothetical protein
MLIRISRDGNAASGVLGGAQRAKGGGSQQDGLGSVSMWST